ncbi:hypothetical protein AAF712_010202 [Marasmius tenuissimus]|uniref:Protein-S-isoprenylcysteine O-methyltransferase n=1 Tax=Marasmius tenuissimus TaxID=585030 RepID=A0ABR2ZP78_9AGAR|nr:hypothetical protein PM082_010969 [Marasmius tenuissimus]
MSLVKLPFLFLSTVSLQVGMTPPNRPPPPTEQYIPHKERGAAHTGEVVLRRILTAGGPVTYFKMLFWIVCILESVTIVSSTFNAGHLLNHSTVRLKPGLSTSITEPTPLFLFSAVLVMVGGIIRVHCFRALGASFTFELSVQKDHKLVTSGLYSVVRHPSYTGAVITLGFAALQHLSRGSWVRESGILDTTWGRTIIFVWFGGIALMIGTLMMRINSEEEMLRKEFGDKWEKWRQDVPYKLFPGVY